MGFLGAGAVVGVQAGLTKDIVTRLQKALLAKGFDPQGIDGSFGPNTARALQAFLNKYKDISILGAEFKANEAILIGLVNQLAKTPAAVAYTPPAASESGAAAPKKGWNPFILGGAALAGVVGIWYFFLRKKGK